MPPANTVAHAAVTIGGQTATVTFSGLSPGFAGLYQIDAVVPTGITPANDVPVIVSIAGEISPTVTIAVK
jgi:adhesin/invasin